MGGALMGGGLRGGALRGLPLRYRLTGFYLAMNTLVYVVFGASLYSYFEQRLALDVDAFLRARVESVTESITFYWQATEYTLAQGHLPTLSVSMAREVFDNTVKKWVDGSINSAELFNASVKVLDLDGRPLAANKGMERNVTLSEEALETALRGELYYETVVADMPGYGRVEMRVVTGPVMYNAQTAFVVQVGTLLVQNAAALRNLVIILLLLVPSTLIITAVAGFYLARIALRPMQRISDAMLETGEHNLDRRISVPGARGEIIAMEESFNRMVDRLGNAFRQQQRLVSDVSHQLKTPLAVLKGELEIALKRARTSDEYERVLGSNLEEVDRMIRIVESMLLLARFDANEIKLSAEDVDLRGMVAGIVEDMRVIARARQIALDLDAPFPCVARVDAGRLAQAVMNIVDNAIKYSSPGMRVGITVGMDAESAIIAVRDSGPGMSAEDAERAFRRFYRSESGGAPGFGLGLSIAQGIVELHGGSIGLETRLGAGSVFTIRLPFAPR